jgi:4-hydroxyphenylpyruvate dioxygenase
MEIDYVHFYVEDAKASCDWFVNYMGFQAFASATSRQTHTVVVKSGAVYFVLSSPLTQESPVAQYLRLHPPGIVDIAFVVSNLAGVMERAIANGAKVLQQPLVRGSRKWGKIAAWGSLCHTLSEYTESRFSSTNENRFPLAPSLQPLAPIFKLGATTDLGLFKGIDHVVLNVAAGALERSLSWYEAVLGFQRQQAFTIQTDRSGLRSQVLIHPESGVQFPINEPTSANSQIQEFLDVNQGPGIQHIALQTPQIVRAIAQLRQLGLSFLSIPGTYYNQLRLNYPALPLSTAELDEIAAQQILVDWQDTSSQALLLQTFTQPIFQQPTFFFELIERRREAKGFGEGNFRALFEAIEREQHKRGGLGLTTER